MTPGRASTGRPEISDTTSPAATTSPAFFGEAVTASTEPDRTAPDADTATVVSADTAPRTATTLLSTFSWTVAVSTEAAGGACSAARCAGDLTSVEAIRPATDASAATTATTRNTRWRRTTRRACAGHSLSACTRISVACTDASTS